MNLIQAVIHNDVDNVRKLLESGADPNACQDHAKVTPLHFAAQHNATDVVPLLITAGANLHAKTFPDNQTPLDIAKIHHHKEMENLLNDFMIKI